MHYGKPDEAAGRPRGARSPEGPRHLGGCANGGIGVLVRVWATAGNESRRGDEAFRGRWSTSAQCYTSVFGCELGVVVGWL